MISCFARDVDDDGGPNTALDIAGQAVRDFNHRTIDGMRPSTLGWQFIPDAYGALGELAVLVGGLRQALTQIAAAIEGQLRLNQVKIDIGTTYEEHPEQAVAAAVASLSQAARGARHLYAGIKDAQNSINAAAYAGPL